MPGYQKLLNLYGSRGFAVIGFKFDTMTDMEEPVQFARKIGVRYPLAVAPEDLKQKFGGIRSEEHTSELQSLTNLVCRLLLEKKKKVVNDVLTTQQLSSTVGFRSTGA